MTFAITPPTAHCPISCARPSAEPNVAPRCTQNKFTHSYERGRGANIVGPNTVPAEGRNRRGPGGPRGGGLARAGLPGGDVAPQPGGQLHQRQRPLRKALRRRVLAVEEDGPHHGPCEQQQGLGCPPTQGGAGPPPREEPPKNWVPKAFPKYFSALHAETHTQTPDPPISPSPGGLRSLDVSSWVSRYQKKGKFPANSARTTKEDFSGLAIHILCWHPHQ